MWLILLTISFLDLKIVLMFSLTVPHGTMISKFCILIREYEEEFIHVQSPKVINFILHFGLKYNQSSSQYLL